jgi:hypothetical protein
VKRKAAMQKLKLAEADYQKAVSDAKLCRLQVQRAKDEVEATSVYTYHVNSTIKQSNYKNVSPEVTTVTDHGQHGIIGTQTISTWMRAAKLISPSKALRQYSRRFVGYNT